VGAMACVGPDDYIITHYREHGQALARGVEPGPIMAELFGKSTGVSKGRGGSRSRLSTDLVAGVRNLTTGVAAPSAAGSHP
jgi:pyruvate dehydrogenase E1 component alpha subunit